MGEICGKDLGWQLSPIRLGVSGYAAENLEGGGELVDLWLDVEGLKFAK